MKILPVLSILFILVFYGAIIFKGISLKKKNIKVNHLVSFKKNEKNNSFNLILFISLCAIALTQILSVFLVREEYSLTIVFRTVGLMFAGAGVIILLLSIKVMKDQWRIGMDKNDKTKLVVNGVYAYSRNPVNLAFYFLYFGIVLSYPNYIVGILSVIGIVLLHLEIIKEEKYLKESYGTEYNKYTQTVNRYI